jgi:hypothetical protein
MDRDDLTLVDERRIQLALEAAISQPLADLLSIEEFVEKFGRPAAADRDREPMTELQRAA